MTTTLTIHDAILETIEEAGYDTGETVHDHHEGIHHSTAIYLNRPVYRRTCAYLHTYINYGGQYDGIWASLVALRPDGQHYTTHVDLNEPGSVDIILGVLPK